MARFVFGRVVQSLILLWLVSMIGFGVLHLAPGGPLAQFALVPGMSQADIARIAAQMGLDQPLPVQYWEWFSRLLLGDWGNSYRDSQPVLAVIGSRLGATLQLMITATLIAVVLGVWIGVMGAIRRYSIFDYLGTIGAMIALSIPTFWFGLVVIYIFSVKLGWLPSGNRSTVGDGSFLDSAASSDSAGDRAGPGRGRDVEPLHALLHARSDQPGLHPHRAGQGTAGAGRAVPPRDAERPAADDHAGRPGIAGAARAAPWSTETVFTWPGMGRLFLDSLGYRDYPVVMGILMFSADAWSLSATLLADCLYAVADPRIRLD